MNTWQDIHAAIDQAKAIVLTTHENPDGDGIGSVLALYHALKKYGKTVYIHHFSPVPRIYHFLEGSDDITSGNSFTPTEEVDVIMSFDCGDQKRLALPDSFFHHRTLINIDHHDSNSCFGDINHVQVGACATGAMVYELIQRLNIPVCKAIAQSLYVTLLTDTGSFRYPCSSAHVYRLAATLIEQGAEPWPIAVEVYESVTPGRMRLLAACLATLQLTHANKVAWLYIDQAMYLSTESDVEDTEGLIDYGRSIAGVEVAILIRQDVNEQWKVTFRGKLQTNVGLLAQRLGGGGHTYAAGCSLKGTYEHVFSKINLIIGSTFNCVD